MDTISLLDVAYSNVINFTLIFMRIFAAFYSISIFRREMATVRIILSLSMILSVYALLLSNPPPFKVDVMSVSFFIQGITQSLIGFISGMIINIVFEVFISTGQIISMQIGLSAASLFDPKFGMITSLTNFYLVVAMILFFGMNGHLMIIDVIVNSFTLVPANAFISNFHGDAIFKYSSLIFLGGVLISMTIISAILITNICLAVMSKFAPQFNLFSVGLNMTLVIGLVCVYLTFNIVVNRGSAYMQDSIGNYSSFFKGLAHHEH